VFSALIPFVQDDDALSSRSVLSCLDADLWRFSTASVFRSVVWDGWGDEMLAHIFFRNI
jgi:hypothetical protein